MKVAYCSECRQVVAAGALPEKPVGGKASPYRYTHRVVVKGESLVHEASLVDVPESPSLHGEKAGKYLARLGKTHAEILTAATGKDSR